MPSKMKGWTRNCQLAIPFHYGLSRTVVLFRPRSSYLCFVFVVEYTIIEINLKEPNLNSRSKSGTFPIYNHYHHFIKNISLYMYDVKTRNS